MQINVKQLLFSELLVNISLPALYPCNQLHADERGNILPCTSHNNMGYAVCNGNYLSALPIPIQLEFSVKHMET